jgi:hypothetical protein
VLRLVGGCLIDAQAGSAEGGDLKGYARLMISPAALLDRIETEEPLFQRVHSRLEAGRAAPMLRLP